jgi:outer membrane immunogenic protein
LTGSLACFRFNPLEAEGGLGGAHVGLNVQIAQVVLGIEAERSWANFSGSAITFSPIVPGDRTNNTSRVKQLDAVTGRIGYAWSNWLAYLRAGVVWVRGEGGSDLLTAAGPVGASHPTREQTRRGRTVGVGVEYGFLGNWSARLEYDYLDFGTEQQSRTATGGGGFTLVEIREHTLDAHEVKIALSYRFGWWGFGKGPVTAAY